MEINLDCSTYRPTGRWMLSLLYIGLFFTAPTRAMQAQGLTDHDLVQWARETVQKRIQENDVPSTSIGIVRAGEILLVDGFGSLERGKEAAVDENSMFQIASQSKMLTGIIVNELLKEGRLNLEQPITKWLGNSLDESAQRELSNVTLTHLLHHRSGIPNYACSVYGKSKQEGRLYWTAGYSKKQLLNDINAMRLEFEPGSKFSYSNSGFALIGLICQEASGLNYDELLEKYVIKKYGLSSTCTTASEQQKRILATPYYPHARTTASKPSDWGMVTPSSGVYSTANDLTKLLAAQLQAYRRGGDNDDNSLVLTKRVDSTRSATMTYGFGIFRNQKLGYANYLHGGNADGYACAYVFSPEKNVGLVLLSSSGGHWFGQLEDEIYHKLVGEEYTYTPERKSLAQAVFDVSAREGVEAGIDFFWKSKESEEYYVRELELDNVGNAMLKGGHVADAIEIFKLVVSEFPDSWNAHESLGEAYSKQGEIELAIESYENSQKMNPNNKAGLKVLNELKKQRQKREW